MTRVRRLICLIVACCLLLSMPVSVEAATMSKGSFNLKVNQGYQFSNKKVVASSSSVDFNFTASHYGYADYGSFSTDRIKEFKVKPDVKKITKNEVATWQGSVLAPAGGYYYLIRARNGKYYLLKLSKFSNQGKATSYWKVSMTWEEVNLK